MRIPWRRWNRATHRDLGYFFVATTLIYALSGIALNHIDDWNPSYSISHREVQWNGGPAPATDAQVQTFLDSIGEADSYKKHYQPAPEQLKVFLEGGSVVVNLATGRGVLERLERRPVLYEVNFLHYNPKRLWTWFSDAYCVALMTLAITGLFILKGKQGITGRGAWLTGIGFVVPLVLLLMYL
jgi:hypothetical protein